MYEKYEKMIAGQNKLIQEQDKLIAVLQEQISQQKMVIDELEKMNRLLINKHEEAMSTVSAFLKDIN